MRRLVVIVALLAFALVGCFESPEGKYGGELYKITCSGCHADDLRGRYGPDIGSGSNAHLVLTNEQLIGVISVGPGAMPGFERKLDADQIESLVAYLRTVQDG